MVCVIEFTIHLVLNSFSYTLIRIESESDHDPASSVIFTYFLCIGNYQQGEEASNLSMKLDDLKIDMDDDDEDEESGNAKVMIAKYVTLHDMI